VIFWGKTDSLTIVYDCNPLKTKDLFSSNLVHKSGKPQKITASERRPQRSARVSGHPKGRRRPLDRRSPGGREAGMETYGRPSGEVGRPRHNMEVRTSAKNFLPECPGLEIGGEHRSRPTDRASAQSRTQDDRTPRAVTPSRTRL
jgi:hypothetical protein